MKRMIKSMSPKYLKESLALVEQVFTAYKDAEEGKLVRRLVEEIRSKKYYLPELELIMVDEDDGIIGYVMFSGFHLEGRYEGELLMLTPAAVAVPFQRQHISKELIEFGFSRAVQMGYRAVLVEGNPANYRARGFRTSSDYGIVPGAGLHLPAVDCLMVKELVPGALEKIKGKVEYDFYETLA